MKKSKRIKDPWLLREISGKPCVICRKPAPSDPSHIKTRGSGGPDEAFNVWPKCREHHSEWHGMGSLTFLKKYPHFAYLLQQVGWEITETADLWHPRLIQFH